MCATRETSRARNLSPAGGWQAHGAWRRWVTQNYPRVRFRARSLHRGGPSVSESTRKKSGGWIGGDRTRWRELRVGVCLTTAFRPAGCIPTTGLQLCFTAAELMRPFFAGLRRRTARNSYKLVTYFVYVNPRGGRYPPDSLVCILIIPTGIFAVGFYAAEYGGRGRLASLVHERLAFEARFVDIAPPILRQQYDTHRDRKMPVLRRTKKMHFELHRVQISRY